MRRTLVLVDSSTGRDLYEVWHVQDVALAQGFALEAEVPARSSLSAGPPMLSSGPSMRPRRQFLRYSLRNAKAALGIIPAPRSPTHPMFLCHDNWLFQAQFVGAPSRLLVC